MNFKKEENTKVLKISMFDSIELTYNNQKIAESSNRSRKIWNLLAYIITYRKKNITQSEFIDMLWPDEESSNPMNALKTMFYRIRLLLDPFDMPEKDFILSSRNSYRWNNSMNCMIDIELFEEYIKKASNSDVSNKSRIDSYKKAMDLYKGDFLSNHSNELWVIPISTHYHTLYINAVKSLLQLLELDKRYEEMEIYCTRALEIDNFDEELHIFLIRTMLFRGNYAAALSHYELTTTILHKELGVKPSKELRELYQHMMKIKKSVETDLEVIQCELKEAVCRPGPYVCEYGIFQEIYRLEARKASREGRIAFLCIITITQKDGELPPQDYLNATMDKLLSAIIYCLRKGDVVSPYSSAQYVFLLSTTSTETSSMILERIVNHYHTKNKISNLCIHYKLDKLKFT